MRFRHEVIYQTLCNELGLRPNSTEVILWKWVRLKLKRLPQDHLCPKSKGRCTKEYHNDTRAPVPILGRKVAKT